MAASSTTCISHGTGAAGSNLVDIPGVYLNKMTVSSTRDENTSTDSGGSVINVDFCNPLQEISHEGTLDATGGLWADTHPGTAVAPHVNMTTLGTFNDFDFADGVIIYIDPSRTYENGADNTVSFTTKHFPLVA